MTEPVPFYYKCDGVNCDRTMGDIGAFLWKHKGNKDYCPDCWDKVKNQ